MTHKTKGIILRTIKYGETSIIATVFTELFGLQSYIVKGVRQHTRKQQKAIYFQPAAILDMVVYFNDLKKLQFIKEYEWGFLYTHLFFDVIKNAVAMYIMELLQASLKQPETNTDLFYFVEDCLIKLDDSDAAYTANLPLFFTLQLAMRLGFTLRGAYDKDNTILDLANGVYVHDMPEHLSYVSGTVALAISIFSSIKSENALQEISLNRYERKEILDALLLYISLHVQDVRNMKTPAVLQAVLS